MDRRLLIGVVVMALGGAAAMGKRKQAQQWLAIGHFLGGPADGEGIEFGVVGQDPCSAFHEAVVRDDIPQRVIKHDHYYSVSWKSLAEVDAGEGGKAAVVLYVYDGLSVGD